MSWILIIVLNSSGNSTDIITHIPFGSREACENAALIVTRAIKPDIAVCTRF